jgi:hypothetical protein
MSITGTTISRNVADSGLGGGIVNARRLTITRLDDQRQRRNRE